MHYSKDFLIYGSLCSLMMAIYSRNVKLFYLSVKVLLRL